MKVFKALAALLLFVHANFLIALEPTVLLSEDFESPDVTGYQQGTRPPGWDQFLSGFANDRHGMVDKDSGKFSTTNDANHQAYMFNYTSNPSIISEYGLIDTIEGDVEYTIRFDVQHNTDGAQANWYDFKLMAYTNGQDRTAFGTVLVQEKATVPTNGQFHTKTFTYTADPITDATIIGQDMAISFRDVWSSGGADSGIIDNILITKPTPPPDGTILLVR